MVFQDYAIFPHLSVAQNVGFGLGKGKEAEARVAELLEFVGLAGYGRKMPQELSGGEQQRVALARALSIRPDVLLLDEPFSNLDATLRNGVRREVRSLLKRSGTTAVFVTHDQEEALFLGDEVAVMRAGQVEQVGTPETVFHRPRTRFVAEFMGQTDFVPGVVAGDRVDTPLGAVRRQTRLPVGTVVEVTVRPDDVAIAPDEDAKCRVISRQFIGIANLYLIRLADGTTVRSWQPHDLILEEGAAVQASLTGDELPVFHRDVAV
jgi:iron(III) transport system ATP-binding protein